MHATEALAEADRLMTICNSCRYCEGLCAVFPALEMRTAFADGDLNYLANLCHGCGACYSDCQFAPPHEFRVNVPQVLARVRTESYRSYAWPRAFAPMFDRNGPAIAISTALSICGFLAVYTASGASAFFAREDGAGAFYRIMPHAFMAVFFGLAFLYAIVASAMGLRMFLRDIGEPGRYLSDPPILTQAAKDAATLRYLDGGGDGCTNEDKTPKDHRRLFHHATFYGFLLCFAATCAATLYHFVLQREAPYAWYDLPVIFGVLGGLGLLIGPIGLLAAKFTRDSALQDEKSTGMDLALLAILFLTSLSGFALLLARATSFMNLALAIHLGIVFSLFMTLPYGKFVHGLYRFAALARYAKERKALGDNKA